MPRYSMWVKNPDFFVQSSNDLDIIKSNYIQADIWLYNMQFKKGTEVVLYIFDSMFRCNILQAKMNEKCKRLNWKPCEN